MPECENCGAVVTEQYSRVFTPGGGDVRCCPKCPDKIRVDGKVRDARAPRSDARAVSVSEGEAISDD